jgi:hypothetical protein
MLRIARKAGAVIERDGAESQAQLRLPAESLASKVEALVKHHAAELDYGLKRHGLRADPATADVPPPVADGTAAPDALPRV